jgi:hypothetical protein
VAEKDMITMSREEARRLHIIHQVLSKKISQTEAALLIDLSDRQIRRMIKRIRKEGDAGICHRSRGTTSNHRIPKRIIKYPSESLLSSDYEQNGRPSDFLSCDRSYILKRPELILCN